MCMCGGGGGVSVSGIPMMLSGLEELLLSFLPLSVFQQQNENQLRQILLDRKLYVKLMAVVDLDVCV